MFTPKQNVSIKSGTMHNKGEYTKYALVVRTLPGGEYVVLNVGDKLDIIARVEDVEPV